MDVITSRGRTRFQSLVAGDTHRSNPDLYGNDGLLLPEIRALPGKEIERLVKKKLNVSTFVNAGVIEVKIILHEGFILFIPDKEGATGRFFGNAAAFSFLAGPIVGVVGLAGLAAAGVVKVATEPAVKAFQQVTDELIYAKYQRHLNEIIFIDKQNILTLDIQQSRKGFFGGEKSASLQVKVKGSFQTFGQLRPDEVSFHILEKHSSLMERFSHEGLVPTASAV